MDKHYYTESLKSITRHIREDMYNDIFQQVAFGDEENDAVFRRLQKARYPEDDTRIESTLYDALTDWVIGSSTVTANRLYKYLDAIRLGRKKNPVVFKPKTPDGTILYRGLQLASKQLTQYILKNTELTQWVPVKFTGDDYVFCTKPIIYKPRSKVQSWSTVIDVAKPFSTGGILITKQDQDFFFNQEIFKSLYDENEREILHFGTSFNKHVYVAMPRTVFLPDQYAQIKSNASGKPRGLKNISPTLSF